MTPGTKVAFDTFSIHSFKATDAIRGVAACQLDALNFNIAVTTRFSTSFDTWMATLEVDTLTRPKTFCGGV